METLANELILDIFEYFSSMDLIHSFNGLNHRFDNLIVDYFQIHKRLDFRLGTKTDVQLIRRRYLPSFIDQIEDLCLSDADTNPHEIDFFLSRLYPFYRFNNVRSISLEHLYSLEKLDRLIDDFPRLPHLTDLQLHRCVIQADQQSILSLMNKIWSLPQLTNLHLGISFDNHNHFIPPTIISCSIRHLIVQGTQCLIGNLSLLYENTPSLESLALKLWNVYDDEHELNRMPTLTKFSCQCDDPSVSFATLFRQMPNLTELTVQTQRISLDGTSWQSIIAKHLLQLKNFQLRMEIDLHHVSDAESEINRIVSSFRTSFWIEEHQWFIRCFWNDEAHPQLLHLHTLPYAFKHLSLQFSDDFCTQTTCPDEEAYEHYHSVTNLTYSSSLTDLTDLWNISFLYLRHLSVTFPLTDSFSQSIPRLNHLKSLEIRIADWTDDVEDLSQLQQVLDQAPRLFSLCFHSWPTSSRNEPFQGHHKKNPKTVMKMAPFTNEHSTIRQLDLRGLTSTRLHHCYNEQQCSTLSRSPLGRQCEYLQIEVEKRTNVLDLVKKMPALRTLNVRCRDRKPNDQELIKWLQDRLPSSCSMAKDSFSPNDIRIWIR